MRWSLLLAVFGLSVTCVASFGQRPPGDQRPDDTRSDAHDNGFFATTGVVRFQLIQGRLCLDPPRHRKGSQQRDENGVYENITVTAERGIPSLHYVYQSGHQHLTMSVHQARSMRIESWLVDADERSVLVQPDVGQIKFSIRRGDLHDNHTGATLIHVRHADHLAFDRHYGLLIQGMLRGESLQMLSDLAEQLAVQQINRGPTPTLKSIEMEVEQLRAPRRAARVAAERRLLAWGTPVVSTLMALPAADLDPEQRARLQSITQQLRPRVGDTPASLAKLLVNDRTYWTAVARRLDADQIQLANRHLKSFGVDPLIIQGEPITRIAAANE